jgi:hypothetical protein
VRLVEETPIAPLGRSDSPYGFRLQAVGSSPAGRVPLWLEYEVKRFDVPFDGTEIVRGPIFDPGFPGNFGSAVLLTESVSVNFADISYRWRARVASKSSHFPHTRWVSPPGNAPSEADLRTDTEALHVSAGIPTAPGARLLAAVNPNPFNASTDLGYSLPQAGRLRLKVYSVTGREVAVLVDGMQNAGEYRVRWDGRDREGQLLPAGVYFAQLELGDRIESQKLVLAR